MRQHVQLVGANFQTIFHNRVTTIASTVVTLFVACCCCTPALKPCMCKVATVGVATDANNGWIYLVPIISHNLSSYNGHIILQFCRKEYTKYTFRTGKMAYDIRCRRQQQ